MESEAATMKRSEVQLLHEATLRILEDVGVRLEHDSIKDKVVKAGAKEGDSANVIRFPRTMVAEYLALSPSTVELANRCGETVILSSSSPPVFWTNPGMRILTGEGVRDLTEGDLAAVARLSDNLPNVQGIMGMAMTDVPPKHRDFVGIRIIAENSRKHVRTLCFTPQGMEAMGEMKQVFPGNWLSMGFTAHGPLRWTHLALDIFLKSSGLGIPATINGEPMAGVTGPVSLAGSAAVGNAEILSGIIVNQIIEPGRPLIYNLGLAHTFDMRRATAVTGGPENALLAQMSGEMGRFYDLPSSSWVSTDSVYVDSQAAMEKIFGFQTHTQGGVGLIWGMGQLESEKTISLAQLVIDNEMIDYIQRFKAGFEITEETLQYGLIKEVGIAGSFLETEHTLKKHREYLWNPRILNRRVRTEKLLPLEEVAQVRALETLRKDSESKIGAAELEELKKIEVAYRAK